MRIKQPICYWVLTLFGGLLALALFVTVMPLMWVVRVLYEEIIKKEQA